MSKRLWIVGVLVACTYMVGCVDDATIKVNSSEESAEDQSEEKSPNGNDVGKGSAGNGEHANGSSSDGNSRGNGSGDVDSETNQNPQSCDSSCEADEKCVDGDCLPICSDGAYCDGDCLDLEALHMADCKTCLQGYSDCNAEISDGCETNIMDDDANNCGGCGTQCKEGQYCDNGTCMNSCENNQISCGDGCVDPEELHLSDCNECIEGFCNADGDFTNGCEVSVKGSDTSNCGACGNVCDINQVCDAGTCVKPVRMMVIETDDLNVRTGPDTTYDSLGKLSRNKYIFTLEEKNGWYRHVYNEKEGWSSGKYLLEVCDDCEGWQAINYAEQFLYDPETRLCTWDHLTNAPIIQNLVDLWAKYKTYNHGYNDNCANFVTACLNSVGLLVQHYIAVKEVDSHCTNKKEGYRKINFEDAKAGDIWVNSSIGHTELVIGYKDGKVYLIGSNNFKSGNNLCQIDTGAAAKDYQAVTYSSSTKGNTAFICSKQ